MRESDRIFEEIQRQLALVSARAKTRLKCPKKPLLLFLLFGDVSVEVSAARDASQRPALVTV
jgi:hypothetical protein